MDSSESETRTASSLPPPAARDEFVPGVVLADRYRVVSRLGRGAMGEVYAAQDLRLGQTVALKFLAETLANDPTARESLFAEARNARTIAHPNVCRVYDIGEMHGRVFLTMEYIDGEDLASLLRRIGRLPGAKALEISQQLCLALAAAHERGILHRDLKPSNVMIDGRGRVRVTDFGLAVNAERDSSPSDFAGTVAYMAPERFRGAPATVQSDLYALGLILYEAFTGQRALTAATSTVEDWQSAHDSSTPTRPSTLSGEVDPATERAILRCLEKDPSRRPSSAARVAASLPGGDPLAAALAAGETPSPALVAASGSEGTVSRRAAWGLLAACMLSMAAAATAWEWRGLVNTVSSAGSPEVLQVRARSILHDLGHTTPPRDRVWWMTADANQRAFLASSGQVDGRFRSAARAVPSPLSFRYREGPRAFMPLDVSGVVTAEDPSASGGNEAIVHLDTEGRLTYLSVRPLPIDRPQSAGQVEPDWRALIALADLNDASLADALPRWVPPTSVDTRRAWTGTQNGAPVRFEAAAYGGAVVFARRGGPWDDPDAAAAAAGDADGAAAPVATVMAVLWILTLGAVALLARRNLTLGRGDRRGAQRVATFVLVAGAIASVSGRHWVLDANWIWTVIRARQGEVLFGTVVAWVFYLGLEPLARRAWPHALVGWTRLLEGRFRDPLVGQALLAGVIFGMLSPIVATLPEAAAQAFGLTGHEPYFQAVSLAPGGAYFSNVVAMVLKGVKDTLGIVSFMVLGRFVLRDDRLVFVTTAIVAALASVSDARPFWLDAVQAGITGLGAIWFLRRFGLLALVVGLVINYIMRATPWTFDSSAWFMWRAVLSAALFTAVAVWGFLSVLGRQSLIADAEI